MFTSDKSIPKFLDSNTVTYKIYSWFSISKPPRGSGKMLNVYCKELFKIIINYFTLYRVLFLQLFVEVKQQNYSDL